MKLLRSNFAVVAAAVFTAAQSTKAVAGKKILVSFDGSGQNTKFNGPNKDNDNGFSNVLKLHLLAGGSIDEKKTDGNVEGQKILYSTGVGGKQDNAFVRAINNYLVGSLSEQTRPIKKQLEAIYEEGDELYLTGYSRGASSARKFAVDLNNKGLRLSSGKRVKKVPIEFLACFDTVSMQTAGGLTHPLRIIKTFLRIVKKIGDMKALDVQSSIVLGEIDGQLPPNVKKAVHNLSLDDVRAGFYTPVLMDSTDKRVTEVWFPGCHGDVGGSYYHDGLSNASGRYMQQFLEDAGVKFLAPKQVDAESLVDPCNPKRKYHTNTLSLKPNAKDISHISSIHEVRSRPILAVSKDKAIKDGTVRIHESLLERILSDAPKQRHKKEEVPYKVNPNLKLLNFVVVGDMNVELPEKTEQLKKALEDENVNYLETN